MPHKRSSSVDKNYGSAYSLVANTTTSSSNLARTQLWVDSQASVKYSPPPSPSQSSLINPNGGTPSSSNRTTASSEQSISAIPRRRGVPPSPLNLNPIPTSSRTIIPQSSIPPTPPPKLGRSSSVRHQERQLPPLPFPQSPPGSGYPMILQVAPPRADAQGSNRGKPPRTTLVRKRRPSLISQIMSIGSPTKEKGDEGTLRRR
ncbi:hypothetical protein ABKN59_007732 [Abortiporus biennis]